MENMFDIFKSKRFKTTHQWHHTPDLSSQFSAMTPQFSATKDALKKRESHIQRSLPFPWLNPLNGENKTSLVQKIAARFVPQEDSNLSQNHDVPDGQETPLSRGGNPVKQRQLFKVSGDKPISEGSISKITVDQLMSYKSATKLRGKQTTVETPDLSNNSAEVKTEEGQLETREELSEKRKTRRTGDESMKKWVEFTRKGEESGKGDQPVLGLLVLVWLINQREIMKDLVELRNNSIHGQKILHSNQDVTNTNLMTLTRQISSLQKSLQKQHQQVHTQMTQLRRLMLLCFLAQLALLVSMATWTNQGVRGRLHNWYRYVMVSISGPTVSLLTTWRDASQYCLHRFTSRFTQMIYSWPGR